MKSIFGFLTGAAIGAGGLFGLRKILTSLEGPQAEAVSSPAPVSVSPVTVPTSLGSESPAPVSKIKTKEAPEVSSVEENSTLSSLESALEELEETKKELEGLGSLVGEPPARHEEPVAAIESVPEAVTPRSESAEPAVPEEVEVKPAKVSSSKSKEGPTAKATPTVERDGKGGKKASKASPTDDFTAILDIGPVFNQKLHDAGIKTFRDLAKLTPAQIEEKTGIPADRIEYGRWIEQVQEILAGKPKD